MIQSEENSDENPVYHLDMMKNRFGPVPKSVRPLYRVGDLLLTDTEWIVYAKKIVKGAHPYKCSQL